MNSKYTISELENIAKEIRKDILLSISEAGSGHTGGSLGLADIFTSLYFDILNHNSQNPNWEERDRLILSIGHVAPVLYAALANSGYFDRKELLSLRKLGTRLQGHPGKNHGLPGLELSSGSLGQGLSVSVGLALSAKSDNKNWNVYTILGDGELQEGSIWEAAMSASHYKLNNLIALVDRNYVQIDGATEKVMNIEPLIDKWEAFGWNVLTCNGNNISDIIKTYKIAQNEKLRPTVIIAETKMGKGVREIENNYLWHGKPPTKEQAKLFIKNLE